jgi:hypothetical protein
MARNRIRKLYLDSAFATEGAGSDITFQLPQQVVTAKGDALALTAMSFPNVFGTVISNFNDLIYYSTYGPNPDFPATSDRRQTSWYCCFPLQAQQYTGEGLAAEIQHALTLSEYGDQSPIVTYNAATGRIHVEVSDRDQFAYEFFTLAQLMDPHWRDYAWNQPSIHKFAGLPLDPNNLRALNGYLGVDPDVGGPSLAWDLGPVNLAPIQQLYVHSNVTDYSTMTSTGSLDVIAVIPVDQNYGSVIHYIPWTPLEPDAIRLEDGVLTTIKFTFTDKYRVPVPMPPGANVYIGLTILELPTV